MTTATAIFPAPALIVAANEPSAQVELLLGQDQPLLDRVTPLVSHQSVSLDLSSIHRIDAAGIAALVDLYRTAKEAGNSFSLLNVPPRIAQTLALFGLDRILLLQGQAACGEVRLPQREAEMQRSAA